MSDKINVSLPVSKSIFNRVLLINALADGDDLSYDVSTLCDDARIMHEVLHSSSCRFDVGNAGTAMRFLTAFLSRIVGHWELTGSARMLQRPIAPLVDALNSVGGHIEYMGEKGYPPLRISGSMLMGGDISISASVSSQYVSALMMVAPYMVNGLHIHLNGKIVSRPYIDMTKTIMHSFGVDAEWKDTEIYVAPQSYTVPKHYKIEADWSAASYFYELFAVYRQMDSLYLSGLQSLSIQGDSRQTELWEGLGVHTTFIPEGVHLTRTARKIAGLKYDFSSMPDLVQTFAVVCCLLDVPFEFSGLETLYLKETDRVQAIVCELKRLGYLLKCDKNVPVIKWDGDRIEPDSELKILTYGDHRMAMAFAAASVIYPSLEIADMDVVKKSFPGYWDEFAKCMGW